MLGVIKSETSDCSKQSDIVSSSDCFEFGVKNVTLLPDSGRLTRGLDTCRNMSTRMLIEE